MMVKKNIHLYLTMKDYEKHSSRNTKTTHMCNYDTKATTNSISLENRQPTESPRETYKQPNHKVIFTVVCEAW